MSNEFTIRKLSGLKEVSAADWNSLTDGNNPFVQYEYLEGLESYNCLTNHGWVPCHLAIYSDSKIVGAIPLYLRTNSYGEFVFDWSWADAYERVGGKYYPKLVSAIPFAPVIGPRLLINHDHPQKNSIKLQLIKKVIQLVNVNNLSSFHCLFAEENKDFYLENKLLERHTVQFHWRNADYRDFQDFLDALTSKKRKQIRKERKSVKHCNIQIEIYHGSEISDRLWQIYYQFYCETFHKRWGNPRLTLDFFRSLSMTLADKTLLILAKDKSSYIAGSFLMMGKEILYGRHWGCSQQVPYLHFELCYYQPIEYCINNGLKYLDAGVQGEHKLARGFEPVIANSYHWIEEVLFRNAISEFLIQEKKETRYYVNELKKHLPYRMPN